jgi:hypothetical protein
MILISFPPLKDFPRHHAEPGTITARSFRYPNSAACPASVTKQIFADSFPANPARRLWTKEPKERAVGQFEIKNFVGHCGGADDCGDGSICGFRAGLTSWAASGKLPQEPHYRPR